jgi:hypothetical protein
LGGYWNIEILLRKSLPDQATRCLGGYFLGECMDMLRITAHLAGPLVMNGRTTFDALLAAVVFDQTGSLESAHADLPLKQTSGLWHASSAIIEPHAVNRSVIVQGMRPDDQWLDHNLIKKNKQGRVYSTFESFVSTGVSNLFNPTITYHADTVDWYATGDADRVRTLLERLPMIGKKRATRVVRWDVEEGELDGVIGYADEPLRPVPVDRWSGDKSGPIVDAAWRPAYWDINNRIPCYVPAFN